ncbi:MAG: hypothetical protein WD334_04410 [Chitinophagales bacterium]
MKGIGNILFWIFLISFTAHQVGQKLMGIELPMLDRYVDPLLGMPLLLYAFLMERRYLWNLGADYTLSVMEIVIATVIVSVISELLFPALSSDFTFDPYDFPAFGMGAVLFYFTMNKKQ